MRRFEGKVVLVTGAAGGFGRRSAERFATEGATLVLSDLEPGRIEEVAGGLASATAVLAGDISDPAFSVDLVGLAVERFGRLDVAVNNAGIVHRTARLPELAPEEARRIVEVNLLGVFHAMREEIPVMERQFRESGTGGTIVNIASVAGLVGAPKLSAYAAAKHGVVGLTRSAAAECATTGVRINAVCPSHARTAMIDGFVAGSGLPEAEALAHLTRGVPMKRVAEIDEVVEAILFAADPKNSFMIGHALAIDGGIGAV